MVLGWCYAAELVVVDSALKRSIIFHIHINIAKAFDYNMRLIRCPGSQV